MNLLKKLDWDVNDEQSSALFGAWGLGQTAPYCSPHFPPFGGNASEIIFQSVFEHDHTPRCSYEVSAAGLSWLKHFRVQFYMNVKVYCYLATRSEVEGFGDQGFFCVT